MTTDGNARPHRDATYLPRIAHASLREEGSRHVIEMTRWPVAETFSAPADDRAPALARRRLAQFVNNPDISRTTYADLLLTELVSNAVKATEPPACRVRILLRRDYRVLTISVWDSSPKEPAVVQSIGDDMLSECGRGLYLVRELSEDWGWRLLPQPRGGKLVWCVVGLT